jgi:hypothetical protein
LIRVKAGGAQKSDENADNKGRFMSDETSSPVPGWIAWCQSMREASRPTVPQFAQELNRKAFAEQESRHAS